MTGTLAERNLITSVIVNSRVYKMTEGRVNAADFSDSRLGVIYEQVGVMLSRGLNVDLVQVTNSFPEWGVRGLSFTDLAQWQDADYFEFGASQYADAVRAEALRRTATDVAQALLQQARDGGVAPAEALTSARSQIDSAIDGAVTGKLDAKPLGEILAGTDSYDWVIPDLLERQDRLILTGSEGAGKTTFARQMCVMAAAGLHPLQRDPETIQGRQRASMISPVKVLVVDAENTEKQWRRAVRYTTRIASEEGIEDPAQEMMVVAGHRIDVTRGVHLGEIHRLIDRHQPDLLYIGPLYKITHGAIQTDDDAAPLLVALDSLRERGITLLMEAHAAKGDGVGARDLRPRGSAALMGWPEFGFGLHPLDNGDVELKRWRGDRDARKWPQFLTRGRDWPWEAS